jgi:signal transduction histidine kinase
VSETIRVAQDETRPLHEIPSLNLHEVLADSARVTAEACQAEMTAVWLLSEANKELHLVASHPAQQEVTPFSIESETLPAKVLREGKPVAIERQEEFPAGDRPMAERLGLQSSLGLPIVIGGRCLGAVTMGHHHPRAFDATDVERGMGVTQGLAVSIEKANLYQEATQRIAELSLLHEVGRAITESLELSKILETCADRLASLLDTSACFVLLKEGDSLVGAVAGGEAREDISNVRIKPGDQSLALAALEARRPLVATDAVNDPRVNSALVKRFNEKSLLAIPMIHRGRAIGVLLFDDRRSQRLFTPGEIERASLVAGQLAAAVDNARLYEDLRRSYAELAHTQQQLVEKERLAALGELAAVVAHEVRNPLGAVFNATDTLRRLLGKGGQTGMLLDILAEEAERINHIVEDLLDFARPRPIVVSEVPLAQALKEASASSLTRPGIRVEWVVAPDLVSVSVDARQLRQALLNLFHNAVQAMPEGGVVRIDASPVERDGKRLAAIEVADSGPGIEGDLHDRIFQPFFTTKATGTGLGLAVVRRIAEAHGGSVEAHNGERGGAVFTLFLPMPEASEDSKT